MTNKRQKVKTEINSAEEENFALGKENYLLLIIGFVVIIIGFLLMSGGKAEDPAVFSDEIFSFRRITLAPLVVLLGFIIEIFAIMKKPKIQKENSQE